MKKLIKLAFSLLILTKSLQTMAQSPINQNRILVPALPFLTFDYGARTAAMGGAGMAISPDANSGFLNPAALTHSNDSTGIAINYTPYARNLINDMSLLGLNAYKIRRVGNGKSDAFNVSIKYFDAGKVELRDDFGNYQGTYSSNELAISSSFSKKLSAKNSMGIALQYVYSNLAGNQFVNGVTLKALNAVNGSIFYYHSPVATAALAPDGGMKKSWLNYGVSLTNIGSKIGYGDYKGRNFQPTTLKIGIAQNWVLGKETVFIVTADASKLLIPTPAIKDANGNIIRGKNAENISGFGTIFQSWASAPNGFSETLKEFAFALGTELSYKKIFSLRGGYFSQNKSKGDQHYYTLGLGLNEKKMTFDFSYLIPTKFGNPLVNTWRIALARRL